MAGNYGYTSLLIHSDDYVGSLLVSANGVGVKYGMVGIII